MVLSIGTRAPDFALPDSEGKLISLFDLKKKNVVLIFYPGDFTPVCTKQLEVYSDIRDQFARYDAVVLAISVDSTQSHAAFKAQNQYALTFLSDATPNGSVGRLYDAYDKQKGTEVRALFVIGTDGLIHWSLLAPYDSNPGADGILDALANMSVDEPREKAFT